MARVLFEHPPFADAIETTAKALELLALRPLAIEATRQSCKEFPLPYGLNAMLPFWPRVHQR
jgi:hypothetical protein